MNPWQEAEQQLARLIGGCVVDDLVLQYKDIDVVTENFSYSVKWQSLVYKYNSILFETKLINSSNGNTTVGSFGVCEADRYAIKWVDANNKYVWAIFDTTSLKEIINNGDWAKQYTNRNTARANKADGRVYDSTEMVRIPPNTIINSDAFLIGINTDQYKD